jgi:PAS domain S-box-containing protein
MTLLRSRLAGRLTVWFLLLSLLPISVVTVFVINGVYSSFDEVAVNRQQYEAEVLVSLIGRYSLSEATALLRANPLLRESVFVVSSEGKYLYHPGKEGGFLSDDLPAGVVSLVLNGSPGAALRDDGTVFGYAPMPGSSAFIVTVADGSPGTALKRSIRRTTQMQLGASLFIMSVVAGLAIWMVVGRPVHQLTEAAERVGSGELSSDINLDDMTDELRVLGSAFNRMMHDLQGLIDGLAGKVSELETAQKALAASEEYFRALVEHAQDIIGVLNADGSVKFVSPAVELVLGYAQGDLIGRNVVDLVMPEDLPQIDALQLTGPPIPRTVALHARHKDGSYRDLEVTGHNLLRVVEVRGIVLNARDVTARKRLEAQVGQAQKMEAIGRLAGGIAHDFNNLLVPIIGYVEMAMDDMEPGTEIYDNLQQVRDAASRASDLTRRILGFSRGQVMEPEVLDLNGIVSEFGAMVQHLIGEDIEFETVLFPDLYRIKADRGQMEQLLMNLAVNARDAMPSGGKLTIETSNTYLDETYVSRHSEILARGPYAAIAVTDNGQGMDEETRQRIFEPFYTTKNLGEGTGLGLSTTFSIVHQHGGNIWV